MIGNFFSSILHKISKIKKHPQLFWTLFIACIITVSFIFVAQQFISLAQDSQERLINVRIESIQNSLFDFIELDKLQKEKLNESIVNFMNQNETILELNFYIKEGSEFIVFASSKSDLLETRKAELSPAEIYALNNPENSYTVKVSKSNNDIYQTYRAIKKDGQVFGLMETVMTLSQADLVLEQKIRNSIILTILILITIILLFFKHSKLIGYISLYEKLKEVEALKDDFISTGSQALYTPLATMRGYSEFLLEASDIPKEYKQYVERIDASSKQLALLVKDMLDVTRIEQDRIKFNFEKILIPDFIESLRKDLTFLVEQKGLQYVFESKSLTHSSGMLDKNAFKQILLNIVGNAAKYTQKGEVKVSLSNESEKIQIRISDTGIGISEQEKKNLFEKFYRIKNDQTKDVEGMGLGLWLTKQLVEKMEGSIWIESIKDSGTQITIEFKAII
jgi:signal transduction histidine kinase